MKIRTATSQVHVYTYRLIVNALNSNMGQVNIDKWERTIEWRHNKKSYKNDSQGKKNE